MPDGGIGTVDHSALAVGGVLSGQRVPEREQGDGLSASEAGVDVGAWAGRRDRSHGHRHSNSEAQRFRLFGFAVFGWRWSDRCGWVGVEFVRQICCPFGRRWRG